jgi:ribonuclease D
MTLPTLHISKDEINRLPIRQYEGPIRLLRTPADAVQAAAALRGDSFLGFDTETRPAFRPGESYPPALLQLAASNEVFVFQLRFTGLPPELCELLAASSVSKTGVAIRSDLGELRKLAPFEPAGFVDLADCARRARIQNLGLRGLAALLLGFRVSKREQTSNWARTDLTESQLRYAATDAGLGREIGLHLQARGLFLPAPTHRRTATPSAPDFGG